MKALGVDFALISMLDVLRDPRWGRSEECFGEDPYLAARMAEAVTKAVTKTGVGVVAKHFAAQGETTGGVNASAARIGMRELLEIHFPPMAAAAEAGAVGVMAPTMKLTVCRAMLTGGCCTMYSERLGL